MEIYGDLFTSHSSLAHCVSQDFKMGAGIAKQFAENFGRKDELISQNVNVGDIAILHDGNRFIYYLVTKEKFWQKPTYSSLTQCLYNLKSHCIKHNVKDISMPKIGCGLDRLDWSIVNTIIKTVFKDTNVHLQIYYL